MRPSLPLMRASADFVRTSSSPISVLVATLLLSLWRPIMEELASAISIDGANYSYLYARRPSIISLP